MPNAQLGYGMIDKEPDVRFVVRLTDRQRNTYANIRRPMAKRKFRSAWYNSMTRNYRLYGREEDLGKLTEEEVETSLHEKLERRLSALKEETAAAGDDTYLFAMQPTHEELLAELLQDLENERVFYRQAREVRAAQKKARVQFGRTNGIARAYWRSERRKVLERQYGRCFHLVRQLKIIACHRMSKPHHYDPYYDKLPHTGLITRKQWEACPAASLRTCVFRAFAKHSLDGKCTDAVVRNVEQDIYEIHQQRTQTKDMLQQIVDACHSFFLEAWETSTYQLISDVTATLKHIRAACKNIHECCTTTDWKLHRMNCHWFFTFFQLARQCKHALISPNQSVYPDKVRRRYKQENRALPHLARCVHELRVVAEATRQQMLALAPKVHDSFVAALFRACPLESMRTVANDGSSVVRITTIAAILVGNINEILSKDDRLKLGQFVRKYISINSIYDVEDRVQLTTSNEHGVLSTHSAYAYREHHIPMLAKACLPFVLGEREFATDFAF
jgi:hypothetical protein